MRWGASQRFEELRETSRLYQLWATYSIVSPDSISKSEYHELKAAGFPLDNSMCLPLKAYILGKEEAHVRPSMRKALDISFQADVLTSEDYACIYIHEERLTSIIKSLLSREIDANYDSMHGEHVDFRSVVVKCLEEIKVIKNDAYIRAIVNKEGVYAKSLGIDAHIVSTGAIHDVMRVRDLPERNLYDLIFLPEDMAKAIGEPTVKPMGPKGPRQEAANKPAPAPSMPGIASPSQTAGPGKPPGQQVEPFIACPYGGGEACQRAGGNGAKQHKQDGVIMKRHAEAMASGDNPPSEEGQKELVQQELRDTVKYDQISHPHDKVLRDLQTGSISSDRSITSQVKDGEGSPQEVWKVSFVGGGQAIAKPIPPKDVREAKGTSTFLGSVPLDRTVGREVASYKAAMLHGMKDLVPPTISRTHRAKNMSMQQWRPDHDAGSAALGKKAGNETNFTRGLLNNCPFDRREKILHKLKQLAIHTMITNDTDKHSDNVILDEDLNDFSSIDGAMTYGTSLSGYKNTMQRDMHNLHMKLQIDQQTQIRLGNMTFKNYREAIGGDVEDWAVGQSFLRNRYLLHLQETEGEIDYEKFRSTQGSLDEPDMLPTLGMWNGLPPDEFAYRKEHGLLPSQLFNSWSKGFLETAAADPSHRDHEDAKSLQELGVFMGPGFARDPEKYRREGKHIEYANSINANMDVPKVIRRDGRKPTTPASPHAPTEISNTDVAHAPTEISGTDNTSVEEKSSTESTKAVGKRRKR